MSSAKREVKLPKHERNEPFYELAFSQQRDRVDDFCEAIWKGDIGTIEHFIALKTPIDSMRADYGLTPLRASLRFSDGSIFMRLLECGAKPTESMLREIGLQSLWSLKDKSKVFTLLSKAPYSISLPGPHDSTAKGMEVAFIWYNRPGTLNFQRRKEIFSKIDKWGALPLHYAAASGQIKTVAILLSNCPEQVSAADNLGYTPLMLAAQNGCTSVVRYLLAQGADPTMKTYGTDLTALTLARKHSGTPEINALLEASLVKFSSLQKSSASRQLFFSQYLLPDTPAPQVMVPRTSRDREVDVDAKQVLPAVPKHLYAPLPKPHKGFISGNGAEKENKLSQRDKESRKVRRPLPPTPAAKPSTYKSRATKQRTGTRRGLSERAISHQNRPALPQTPVTPAITTIHKGRFATTQGGAGRHSFFASIPEMPHPEKSQLESVDPQENSGEQFKTSLVG